MLAILKESVGLLKKEVDNVVWFFYIVIDDYVEVSATMQQRIFSAETHQNHYLFSDHYLNDVLPKLELWGKEEAAAAEVKEKLRRLYLKNQN